MAEYRKNNRTSDGGFHYGEIRTPIFEHTELFQRGVGDTTDIVQKECILFWIKENRSITLNAGGDSWSGQSLSGTQDVCGSAANKIILYYPLLSL